MSDVEIQTDPTPNPSAYKFTIRQPAVKFAPKQYKPGDDTGDVAVAKAVLDLPGVASIFMTANFVSVTQDGGSAWPDLAPKVESAIREALS